MKRHSIDYCYVVVNYSVSAFAFNCYIVVNYSVSAFAFNCYVVVNCSIDYLVPNTLRTHSELILVSV